MPSARRPHILPRIDNEPAYAPLGGGQRGRGFLSSTNMKRIALVLMLLGVGTWFAAKSGPRRDILWGYYGSDDVRYPADLPSTKEPLPPSSPPADDEILPYPPSRPAPPEDADDEYDPEPATTSTALAAPPAHTPSKQGPTSPDDDPNPSGTVHCTVPAAGKPIVQYALMIDAGSTGSRIHVYKFHNCMSSPTLEYEVFRQNRPGLSSYEGRPLEAARSLDELLDEAVRVIPKELQKCTPVAVKATAGLRLLGARQSTDILEAVEDRLNTRYPFQLIAKDGVVIMDGKDEGVYAWITANYLLQTIGSSSMSSQSTYAVLDLGGASTQIVFEPKFSTPDSSLEDGDHRYELHFAGRTHTLYQHSYLGYGLMRARRHVHNLIGFMWDFGKDDSRGLTDMEEVGNPCLAKGTRKMIELEFDEKVNVTMLGADVGSFEGCNRIVELVMAKDAICHVKPCSFNGVYQPSILDTFPSGGILTLSYFYDRITPLLPVPSNPNTPMTLPISSIAELATRVCAGPSSWAEHFAPLGREVMDELEGRPEWCLDLTFQHALLRLGYEFGPAREIRVEKKVEGVELGWCLGATIAMLDGDLECKV